MCMLDASFFLPVFRGTGPPRFHPHGARGAGRATRPEGASYGERGRSKIHPPRGRLDVTGGGGRRPRRGRGEGEVTVLLLVLDSGARLSPRASSTRSVGKVARRTRAPHA